MKKKWNRIKIFLYYVSNEQFTNSLCSFFFFRLGTFNVCGLKLKLEEKKYTHLYKAARKMQNLNVHVLKKRLEKHLNYNASRTHFSPLSLASINEERIKIEGSDAVNE